MKSNNPTPDERDERVTVPEGTNPEEFLARLLAVDPEDEDADAKRPPPSDGGRS